MLRARTILWLTLLVTPVVPSLAAQSSGGSLAGRVTDEQDAAVSGVLITAKNLSTGFVRATSSDDGGAYYLTALPVGNYDVTAARDGFRRVDWPSVEISVARTQSLNVHLEIAPVSEIVSVTGVPLIAISSAAVGARVDPERIESLPLNGRQFANLAATLPGVGLGFHIDPTKVDQYVPLLDGGGGRNINFQVDGGDNNDDTVGGLLQPFPLEAIQEFNVQTDGAGAEYGRNAGAVVNVVTKSGTNEHHGSWLTFFRDDALNARTTTEKRLDVDKGAYRRWQYGGSLGGPIVRDRLHYFGAFEPTAQDTFQPVSSEGLYPELDGTYPVSRRANLLHVKATWNTGHGGYLSARYGRSTNSNPTDVTPRIAPPSWGSSQNWFNSANVGYTRGLGRSAVNELVVQYSDFANWITSNSTAPAENYPNRVVTGIAPSAPQATEQTKWQIRDDVSWHVSGRGGLGHDFKAGASVVNEPKLGFPNLDFPVIVSFTHITNDPNGPLSLVTSNGPFKGTDPALNVSLHQYAVYVQDVWRIGTRLTLNAGLRYDLTTGFAIDQSANGNFVVLQEAAHAGRFAGIQGFEDFGKDPRDDFDNIQPRLGAVIDLDGAGQRVIRASWGIYSDFGYINQSILFPAAAAFGGAHLETATQALSVSNPNGIRNPDGSYFHTTDPLSNIADQNEIAGPIEFGHTASPRLEQPYARRASAGMSSQIGTSTVVSVDYVHDDGRDLSARLQLNTRVNGGARRFADLPVSPANFRIVTSDGKSQYDALITSINRRGGRLDLSASYTLGRALASGGVPTDSLGNGAFIQDATQPFAPVQFGPAANTPRHLANLSAIVLLGRGFQFAPILLVRSALPVHITEGLDLNNDGQNTEIGKLAFRYNGPDDPAKEIGTCATVDCGWGAAFSQMNIRLSKRFALNRQLRADVIAEVFNVFNASNPNGFNGRRFNGTIAAPTPSPDFMSPTAYAGDSQQPEQRIAQLGFRLIF